MDNAPSKNRPPAGEVTRFRPDRRPAVAATLRVLGLMIMLGAVAYGGWAYRDELRIGNVRRLLSYVQAASQSTDGFAIYRFEPGLETVYAPFELGLAVVSSDTYRFVTGFGGESFSSQLKYANPAIQAGDRQVLIYDRGGTGYCLANSYTLLHSGVSQSAILAAAMNARGGYMLVTEESGYRAGVYVYDERSREVCVWQTPSFYVMLPSLGPEGDRFAVLGLSEADGGLSSQVRGYAVGDQTPVFTVDFGQRRVLALRHYKNGNLFILCEDGLYVYSPEGKLLAAHPLSDILRFVQHEGGLPLVAVRVNTGTGQQTRLLAFDEHGAPAYQTQVSGTLRDLDFREGYGMALFYDRVYVLDLTGSKPRHREIPAEGVRRVLCAPRRQGIFVYSDRAEGIALDGEMTEDE